MLVLDKVPERGATPEPRRIVRDLSWARLADAEWCPSIPKPRSASSRRGIAYEKFIGKELKKLHKREMFGDVLDHPWICFGDSKAHGYAQPDFLVMDKEHKTVFVLEVKLTQTIDAFEQLNKLYIPLVKEIFPRRKVEGVQISKNIITKDNLVQEIEDWKHNTCYQWIEI